MTKSPMDGLYYGIIFYRISVYHSNLQDTFLLNCINSPVCQINTTNLYIDTDEFVVFRIMQLRISY